MCCLISICIYVITLTSPHLHLRFSVLPMILSSSNEILSPHQYGFRPNRSTYMAINDLYCKITDDLDNKHHSLGIFLDLSKAFDTLNHDILLHKLNMYGIRGLANSWIQNNLSNRKQYVVYNNSTSLIMILFAACHKDQSLVPFISFIH